MARYLWQLFEPLHALVYFAPGAKETYESIGLKGGWMGYFASRSGAMGEVGPGVVTATFFNFHPAMVARALPDAWELSTPRAVLAARLKIADSALRFVLGDGISSPEVAEAAELAVGAARAGTTAGRPLYAAHVDLPLPGTPHLDLWAGCTALREHRGDGHVACLLKAGLDGCEANVMAASAGTLKAETQKKFRGWSDDEWAAAEDRLRGRGWLDGDGLTDEGRAARAEIEDATDRLALEPFQASGERDATRFVVLLEGIVGPLLDSGAVRYPNPIGLTRPERPA